MKNRIFVLASTIVVALGSSALGSSALASQPSTNLLPSSFNGWQKNTTTAKASKDATVADQADAEVLKEYGFSDMERATYVRDDRKMQVKAARFEDASGALGAFTYYVQPQMQTEQIPDKAVSNNSRVLFYRGNILIDVLLDRVTAMSATDLRALSDALPHPHGSSSALPALASNLPKQSFLANTGRYVMGPVALGRLGLPLPANLVDFTKGPELVSGKYRSSWGEANLILIEYPTPQIAAERLRTMQAAALPGGPFYFKRSGPLVAAMNGNIPEGEAQSLLASVNYDAEVTWNQRTKPNAKDNIGNLIVAVFALIAIILVVALVMGVAFGGIRVLVKKIFPDRVFDRSEDVEIIRLNLK
ncbi:MAG TPA: DUF6599 family protein [Candidatus Angelobacter sp.]|nr:DUF6599 family protein [Candidatus Angelobacter sp.]